MSKKGYIHLDEYFSLKFAGPKIATDDFLAKNRIKIKKNTTRKKNLKILSSKMKNILTIIPARSGSKGIKNKNLKILNGKSLVIYSIEIAKKLKKISDICVSTDSIKIRDIVKNYSLDFYGFRPSIYQETLH